MRENTVRSACIRRDLDENLGQILGLLVMLSLVLALAGWGVISLRGWLTARPENHAPQAAASAAPDGDKLERFKADLEAAGITVHSDDLDRVRRELRANIQKQVQELIPRVQQAYQYISSASWETIHRSRENYLRAPGSFEELGDSTYYCGSEVANLQRQADDRLNELLYYARYVKVNLKAREARLEQIRARFAQFDQQGFPSPRDARGRMRELYEIERDARQYTCDLFALKARLDEIENWLGPQRPGGAVFARRALLLKFLKDVKRIEPDTLDHLPEY